MESKPLGITDVVLRDGHRSLLATRLRTRDMLPIAHKLDQIGFWSLEVWGGATFDSCIRYLGEDPWERLRQLRKAIPNTPLQMLLRGQNILGYRHYADDVVEAFIERSAKNGIDVIRIFDAMNDPRNLETAIKATVNVDKHAQGTISYTVSPVHTMDTWVDLGRRLEDMGCHSICIKDMAGLLKPYVAEELVSRLKEAVTIPLALHCHATTGMSTETIIKATEAGLDIADTSISSMSMTYGHSATESIVAIMQDTPHDTGIALEPLEEIAAYFREVRSQYAKFEGSLRGVDSRILVAQVPGGMLTNMENQLREQDAIEHFDAVLEEIPRVRKALGYIPLVTPTSQIVGTQAVLNVLLGKPYKSITKETSELLKGNYGTTPAPVDHALQLRVLDGESPVTCRPANLLEPEMIRLTKELTTIAREQNIDLATDVIDDVLTYALFPQVGLKFLKHRGHPEQFEPHPADQALLTHLPVAPAQAPARQTGSAAYRVTVDGTPYQVEVSESGQIEKIEPGTAPSDPPPANAPAPATGGQPIPSPLAGNIFKIVVTHGQQVAAGEVLVILEAMKMETEVRAPSAGTIDQIVVREGDAVQVGETLATLA